MMKIILLVLGISIFSFASTRYVTPNMVVQNSELYCVNSDKIVVYTVGDIVDGDFAKACSYNKDTIEYRLEKMNEYNNSFIGKFYYYLKILSLIFIVGLLIFSILIMIHLIKSTVED